MTHKAFDYGLDHMEDWLTSTFKWMLLQPAWNGDQTAQFVSGVGNEVSVASYVRQTASSKVRTVDTTLHTIKYSCANLNFGDLESSQSALWVVLFKQVTNDADSIPILALDLISASTLGDAFTIVLPDGVATAQQG